MDAALVRQRWRTRERDAVEALTRRVGEAIGWVAAPAFAVTSSLRRARTFHPQGDCADGVARPHPDAMALHFELADRLSGPVLVRFSDALARRRARWPDVLGCALRFGHVIGADGGDQDLLFATIKRPWTMPFAPFTTKVGDYLGNDYFAVSPFSIRELGRAYLRLRPERPAAPALRDRGPAARRRRLDADIASGGAALVLGIATGPRGPFLPVVRVDLVASRRFDPPALRFDPFRDGRGIVPVGLVHGLRRGPYAASQLARAITSTRRPRPGAR